MRLLVKAPSKFPSFLMITCLILGIGSAVAQVLVESHTFERPEPYNPPPIPLPSYNITTSLGLSYPPNFESLQQATWDLNATHGGWIAIPACTLEFTHAYYPINNLKITGSGNDSLFHLAPDVNTHMIIVDGQTNISISRIRFDMNGAHQHSLINLSVIYQRNYCNHITIEHCSFYNGYGSYIYDYWDSPSSNVTVSFCQFHAREHRYWQGAISFAGADCNARDNFVENTWACGIRIHGSQYHTPYPRRCLIEGNYITGQIGHGIHMEYAQDCTILNNTIVDLNCSAYKGYDTTDSYSSGILATTGTLVEGNIINHVNYRAIASGGHNIILNNTIINVEDVAGIVGATGDIIAHNSIFCNLFANHPTYGIRVLGPTIITDNILICRGSSRFGMGIYTKSGNSTISHNQIQQSTVGIGDEQGQSSMISGNTINDSTAVAIILLQSPFSTITGNTMSNVKSDLQLYASRDCHVSNNTKKS